MVTRVSLDFKTTEDATAFWENFKKLNPESTWQAVGLEECHIYIPHLNDRYRAEIGDNLDQKEN